MQHRFADALLEFAEALAKQSTSASIHVPALFGDGSIGMVEVLVGPASQLFAVPESSAGHELLDDAALRPTVVNTAGERSDGIALPDGTRTPRRLRT